MRILFCNIAWMNYYKGTTDREYLNRLVNQIENYNGENWIDKYEDES